LHVPRVAAPQLTFDFYLEQFPRNDADGFFWQKPTFKLVSENGVVASGQIMASEIEKLKLLIVQVETLVDKELAHLDRKEFDSRVTFNDLDRDTLDEVACEYICLLTGKEYSTLKATVQFDWKKVFRVPLQKPPA